MTVLEPRQQKLEELIGDLAKVTAGLSGLIADKNAKIAELEDDESAEDERDVKYLAELTTLTDNLKNLTPAPAPATEPATPEEITTPI